MRKKINVLLVVLLLITVIPLLTGCNKESVFKLDTNSENDFLLKAVNAEKDSVVTKEFSVDKSSVMKFDTDFIDNSKIEVKITSLDSNEVMYNKTLKMVNSYTYDLGIGKYELTFRAQNRSNGEIKVNITS